MASPSRTSQLNKLHKVVKKRYTHVSPDLERPVFEQLVFACCLENAHYDRAEQAYAALEQNFFDWNEIRVTTIRELSEVIACLPDPPAAANRVKRVLQSVFEGTYSFTLEELRKQNLGPAIARLRKIDGAAHFAVAYVTQVALGGHAIPVDAGVLGALEVVGLVGQQDVEAGVVPGLERAIPKSRGLEFASQLHQLGADFFLNPCAPDLHKILLEINPDARDRLPKRRRKRPSTSAKPAASRAGQKQAKNESRAQAVPKTPKSPKKRSRGKAKSNNPDSDQAAQAKTDQQGVDSQAGSSSRDNPPAKDQGAPAAKKKSPGAKKRSAKKKGDAGKRKSQAAAGAKKSTSEGLSRRKPR
jgi:endonuclease-3